MRPRARSGPRSTVGPATGGYERCRDAGERLAIAILDTASATEDDVEELLLRRACDAVLAQVEALDPSDGAALHADALDFRRRRALLRGSRDVRRSS